jgi:hypothetical protein
MADYATDELKLAEEVVPALRKGMLCLAERFFPSYKLRKQASQTGADLLWRTRQNARLDVERRFRDGSYRFILVRGYRFVLENGDVHRPTCGKHGQRPSDRGGTVSSGDAMDREEGYQFIGPPPVQTRVPCGGTISSDCSCRRRGCARGPRGYHFIARSGGGCGATVRSCLRLRELRSCTDGSAGRRSLTLV